MGCTSCYRCIWLDNDSNGFYCMCSKPQCDGNTCLDFESLDLSIVCDQVNASDIDTI